jgi:acyl carrier protein
MPERSPEQAIVERIETIFIDTLSIAPPAPEVDMIEAALLDSLGLVTLLFEVEQEFGVQLPLESLELDDFRSVERIAGLIARMQGEERSVDVKEKKGGRAPSRAGDGPVGADTGKGART